jgi:L-ribulokinase
LLYRFAVADCPSLSFTNPFIFVAVGTIIKKRLPQSTIMKESAYVIGVDYGTDSVRSLLVDAHNGSEIAASTYYYPRWKAGQYCNAQENQWRQHPLDYVEGLENTIKECLAKAGKEIAAQVKGISVDTTGSTPVAVDATGTPLAMLPQFATNPNAMFVLWKDHTAIGEAAELNAHAQKFDVNYLQFVGGIYSSEWFWAKLLRTLRVDESIRNAIYTWVEHCDWIPFLLTGGTDATQIKRSVCAAGHKALWAKEYNGYPPNNFFTSWDPLLNGFTSRMSADTYASDKSAGYISAEWANKLGLSKNVVIGIGAFDAHMGAVGGQIEPYYLSKVMGTSTCDMLVAPSQEVEGVLVKGICGQVPGSVIPGMIGMEAGQSAFGDAYAWFKNLISWPIEFLLPKTGVLTPKQVEEVRADMERTLIMNLSLEAAKLPLHEDDEIAVDWLNGRRTPDANQALQGAFAGLGLGSLAPQLFKALVEATCFGAKAIVDRFREEGVPIIGLIGLGGVAKKSKYIMQVMANVMNMPIRIHKSDQTCAAGAAMFAATAAGLYPAVEEAMTYMGQGFEVEYQPEADKVEYYAKRMEKYKLLGGFAEQLAK